MAKKRSKNTPSQKAKKTAAAPSRIVIGRIASGLIAASILFTLILYYISLNPKFNSEHAFTYLEKQCEFGPRVPGTEAHAKCGDYLVTELQKFADQVSQQQFQYIDKHDSAKVYTGRNIIASFNLKPEKNYRVMLCAHWDSRPFADQEADSARHSQPVPGANDGASGVAVLLEMANILHHNPLDFGIDIVFFDLEDIGDNGAALDSDSLNPFCIGSQYFVDNRPNYRPRYGILLDMVGGEGMTLKREGYSWMRAPQIVTKVWDAAKEIDASVFSDELRDPVLDDHVPFLEKGVKVIDLIDFDYPYWHTVEDTPDKCSPQSLQQVGDVLVEVLYNEGK